METFLLIVVIAVALIRWIYLRQRLSEMSGRIDALARLVVQSQARSITAASARPAPPPTPMPEMHPVAPVPPQPAAPAPPPPPHIVPPTVATPPLPHFEPPIPAFQPAASVSMPPAQATVPPTPVFDAPVFGPPTLAIEAPAPVSPRRSTADWEALVGGNLLNKAGVFVLVIFIALLLSYAFNRMGPGGRVAISIGVSLSMLAAGVVVERRDRYRIFAQGLLGGGWAALYFTVYAMQALPAAKVIDNPLAGAILLLAVASGMIVHSLRYRSQTVTGLAYFIAFVTLGITHSTPLSVLAVVPLAASLLYVAHRFEWRNFALFGLVATYR